MRRVLSLVTASLLVLFVTAVQAQAQVTNFTALLHGGNEVPPVLTGAAGTATISYNATTGVLTYRLDIYNMPVGTTAGHFHVGAPGTGGPTVVNFTIVTDISNDYAIVGTATAISSARAAQGINTWEDFIQALFLGNTYVNVHSTANGGGEIRGQVIRVQ